MPKKKSLLTVVIPLKNTQKYNRGTKRLEECLKSLQGQTAKGQFEVIVADIDSDTHYKQKHKEISEKYGARHAYVKTDDVWNISRARNIGIRNAKTDYVMTTDVDCIFAPDFIEAVLKNVGKDKIVHCRISDLPDDYNDSLDNFLWMNKLSTLRPQYGYGGCQVFPRAWAFKIHGFDEEYRGWGADDTDFYYRAIQDGLESIWIEKEASFFHQWHPMDNRIEHRVLVEENRKRLRMTEDKKLPLIRNDRGWGGKGVIAKAAKKPARKLEDVAVLITTFMRDEALFQCIESIREYYSNIAVFIGDNGRSNKKKRDFCKKHNCTYVQAPFDCGVGATRNAVFQKMPAKYKYVMICEDDTLFTEGTRLENWVAVLEAKKNIGIVGGLLQKQGKDGLYFQNYEAWIYAKAATLYIERVERAHWYMDCKVRYMYCDIVLNIFMMKREVWDARKWDENMKTWPEHEDFFFGLKKHTEWRVAYTDEVSIIHRYVPYSEKYAHHRMRMDGAGIFSQKWDIEYIWNSWHPDWGKPNPMRIGPLMPRGKPTVKAKKDIAIGIKTFMREESFFKTLNAIEEHFPYPYRLYIADDGHISDEKEYRYQKLERDGHVIIRLPFNCGISIGRNSIVKAAIEDYVLIMDDDIVLQDDDSIKNMRSVLDADKDIGLVSGMLFDESGGFHKNENYQKGLRFEIDRGMLFRHLASRHIKKVNGAKYVYADQVVNFFLARRDVFDTVKWDPQIKVEYEHMDFFLRLKETPWKAAACLDTKATHLNGIADPTYNQYRWAITREYFLHKHNLHNTINRFN